MTLTEIMRCLEQHSPTEAAKVIAEEFEHLQATVEHLRATLKIRREWSELTRKGRAGGSKGATG